MIKALYQSASGSGVVTCLLCPHACEIASEKTGLCGSRYCDGEMLYSGNYGRITSIALDPVEKKPLRRFHSGAMILSVGSYGCNMRCPFCQNHGISMGRPRYRRVEPEALAELSLSAAGQGNIGVAYTYNEPLIGYEFVLDCAKLIRRQGQKNVLVTNGYLNEEPLLALLPYIDAANIDLKCFNDRNYRRLGGGLEAVKRSIRLASEACHVEVTALIVPDFNDSGEEMEAMAGWLASVNPDIPLHVSRFLPRHKLADAEATPVDTIYRLADIAGKHLRYVYTGNC